MDFGLLLFLIVCCITLKKFRLCIKSKKEKGKKKKYKTIMADTNCELIDTTFLLEKFKPQIVFDSNEMYYPSSVEFYLANCVLRDVRDSTNTIIKGVGEISVDILPLFNNSNMEIKLGSNQPSLFTSCFDKRYKNDENDESNNNKKNIIIAYLSFN